MAFNAEEEFKRLDEIDRDRIKSNSQVIELLKKSKERTNTVEVNGYTIRTRTALTSSQRSIIADLQDSSNADAQNKTIYILLSKLCVDEPFTDPATWMVLDEEEGVASTAIIKIVESIMESDGLVTNFRKK